VRPHPRRILPALLTAGALMATAACGGGFDSNSSADTPQKTGKADLKVLIASSGDAETSAVQAAAKKWSGSSGNTATVTVAQNMDQQLGQAFAANQPPDVFYLDASKFADYAAQGALYAYGDKAAGASDFYPNLKDAFTYKGTFYCAPKDFSTLALEINTDLWKKAGLTDSDVPTTWDQLRTTLTTLKSKLSGVTPLVISPGHDRVDPFIVQAGGRLVDDQGKVTADSPENVAGLTYAQSLLKSGLMKYSSDVGAGWGGEAFGKGKAAMTIEGNWIKGAMKSDYPNVKYQVAPLPAGAQKGTLAFTQCWGIPAASK
jgi:multiple sugar transport system substrate-binding protein